MTTFLSNKLNVNLILGLTLLFIIGCSTNSAIKTFANKDLPATQYAKLEAPTGILILEIDGKELEYAAQYHILPGKHQLHVMVSAFKGEKAYKVGDIDITFIATAEHVYHIKSLATNAQQNKDFSKKTNKFLWIEDKTLDTVVAGKKP